MTITDEMVEKALDVFSAYGDFPLKDAIRDALEAVAPMLREQWHQREAEKYLYGGEMK